MLTIVLELCIIVTSVASDLKVTMVHGHSIFDEANVIMHH